MAMHIILAFKFFDLFGSHHTASVLLCYAWNNNNNTSRKHPVNVPDHRSVCVCGGRLLVCERM